LLNINKTEPLNPISDHTVLLLHEPCQLENNRIMSELQYFCHFVRLFWQKTYALLLESQKYIFIYILIMPPKTSIRLYD
jgi:hypothetical protein